MATAPCRLQAQVNDFTKSYSNPDIKSMGMAAASNSLGLQTSNIELARSHESILHVTTKEKDHKELLRKSPMKDENGHQNGIVAGDGCLSHEDEMVKRRSASILEVKEHANTRLSEELLKAQKELMLKDEQCKKLAHVQEQMSNELEELTAKLFEEANKMVQDANIKRLQAEKLLKESNSKIDVLEAEVTALKTLVITSTPSMPNRHLHPQIEVSKKKEGGAVASVTSFIKGHRRSTSHHNFTKEIAPVDIAITPEIPQQELKEVEPYFFNLFKNWHASSPKMLDQASPFLNFIINGDIMPCLAFSNKQLSQAVFRSILNNTLTIEPDQEKNPFPRPCSLTNTTRVCKYRIRLGDGEPWHVISQLARNRVTAVCNFFTYIRYITQGLVKSDGANIYWEVIRLRKQVCLSTLGLS